MNVLNNFETHEIIDGFRNYVAHFSEYAELAQLTSNDAESWRNFEVGVTAVGIQPGVEEPTIIAGANSKIDHTAELDSEEHNLEDEHEHISYQDLHDLYDIPKRPPKNCGELEVLQRATDLADEKQIYLVGFLIAASTDPADIHGVGENNVITQTLTPCGDVCVPMLTNSRATSRATLYASTGYSANDIFQIRNIRDLNRLQKSRSETMTPESFLPRLHFNLGARALEVFDNRMEHTVIVGKPSRAVSVIARQALVQAGREV
jgi:hypothetical protein